MTEGKLIANMPKPIGRLPFGRTCARNVLSFEVDVHQYFGRVDIQSIYLRDLIVRSLWKIIHSGFRSHYSFGSLVEGETIAGGIAEVTGDHCIRIDSRQLKRYEESVAMALLAHELAHDHLRHFKSWKNNLDDEDAADNLARVWGFNVDQFRKTCGPAGMNNRLQRIAVLI